MSRNKLEEPVDYARDEEDEEDESRSDLFEMRFCEAPECSNPLPLDRPGHRITIYGQNCLVCDSCHQSHEM